MDKKRLFLLIMTVMLVIAIAVVPALGIADAGDFSGSGDYGGGSDWGSSSDWDSSSSDWGGSSYSSGALDVGFPGFITAVVVIVIIIAIANKNKKKSGSVAPGAQRTVLPMTIGQLKQMDPQFSEEALKERIANLYIKMQAAWQTRKWEPMRADLTDTLFNQMKSGVDAKIRAHQTNYVERIAILGVELTGFGQDDKHDIVTAVLQTRIVDYTLDDATGRLVSGSKTAEKFMTYEWTMIRTKGAKTAVSDKDETKHCPNCGAPLDLNNSTKCPYCGSIITAAEYDWVLNNIKGLSQRTAGK